MTPEEIQKAIESKSFKLEYQMALNKAILSQIQSGKSPASDFAFEVAYELPEDDEALFEVNVVQGNPVSVELKSHRHRPA